MTTTTATVATGYATTRTRAHHERTWGHSANAPHSAQAQWRLGIAAYWLEMASIVSLSNDQNVG